MKHILILLVLLTALVGAASFAQADSPITVSSDSFVSKFPQTLAFQLEAQSTAKITDVALHIQIGSCVTNRYNPTFTPDTKIQATYQWNLKQNNQTHLPPGVNGQYWWVIQDSAGNQLTTPKQSFRVDDPAHTWQKLANDKLGLYWYSGGQEFGQALYNRGLQAISFLEQDLGVTLDQQVQIFIYATHDDLMQSLAAGMPEWIRGQAFPTYSIVLIGVAPSELNFGLGGTAHELTHQVVHRAIQNGCGGMGSFSFRPLMDEGLAVYNENPGSADPQYTVPLRGAVQNNTLIPLRELWIPFPPADPNVAFLSYGESWSFVDFLIRHYGKAKLGDWLQAVKAGGTIDDLFQQVYGKNLDQLENEWRQDVGAQQRVIPTQNAATPTPFPTFGLSSGDTPVPSAAFGTATPAPVAAAATAIPPPRAPGAPANPASNLCGGVVGLMAFGTLGTVLFRRWHRPGSQAL